MKSAISVLGGLILCISASSCLFQKRDRPVKTEPAPVEVPSPRENPVADSRTPAEPADPTHEQDPVDVIPANLAEDDLSRDEPAELRAGTYRTACAPLPSGLSDLERADGEYETVTLRLDFNGSAQGRFFLWVDRYFDDRCTKPSATHDFEGRLTWKAAKSELKLSTSSQTLSLHDPEVVEKARAGYRCKKNGWRLHQPVALKGTPCDRSKTLSGHRIEVHTPSEGQLILRMTASGGAGSSYSILSFNEVQP